MKSWLTVNTGNRAIKGMKSLAARSAALLLTGALAFIPACSQQVPTQPRKLMAIPPAMQEIQVLNARAALLAKLRLTGNVSITLINHDGSTSNYQAHAVLLVDQNRVPHLLLVGTYLGQDAFELGMNRRIYWLIDHEHKIAYAGRVEMEYHLPPSVMPLRPQRILEMLGITPLMLTGDSRIAMFNVPHTGRYNLLLMRSGGDGLNHIKRQITISRYNGQISEVRLYDRNGRVIAYADLSQYKPLAEAFDGVEIPFHIVIHYLDAQAEMDFQVHHAALKFSGKPKFIFATPSFQGLKVADMDNPVNWGGARQTTAPTK